MNAHSHIPMLAASIAAMVLSAGCSRNSGDFQAHLPGRWMLISTNAPKAHESGDWMNTETEYRPDHTFELRGEMGNLAPTGTVPHVTVSIANGQVLPHESKESAEGSGVWRIDQGLLYTRFTRGNWQTNAETCWRIVSLNGNEFTYRRKTAQGEGPLLKAIRK